MKFSFAVIAFVLFTVQLFAQPGDLGYEPPAGWTYVRNVDSINNFELKVYNDSIVTYGYNRKATFPQMWLRQISYDGGITWDTVHFKNPQYTQFGYAASEGFFPLSARFYRTQYDNSFNSFVILLSDDLGKTFVDTLVVGEVPPSAGTNNFPPRLIYKPNQVNQLFYLIGPHIFRSSDAGKTWFSQKVPKITGFRDNNGADITFDHRNPTLWYLLVSGDSHHAGGWVDFYRTRNDGQTFDSINLFPKYAGIASEGIMRNPWVYWLYTNKGNYIYQNGMIDYLDNGDTLKKHNWAERLYGSSYPNYPKGEIASVNTYYNYTFLEDNPHIAFVSGIKEEGKDSLTGPPKIRRDDLWMTFNDGETWTSIWSGTAGVNDIYVDKKTKTVYVRSAYSPNFYDRDIPVKNDIWKRQISTSVEDNANLPTDFKNVTIAPNPAENFTQISFKNSTGGKVEIALYDVLGTKLRTIYSGTQEAGEQKILWNIPAEIPSGTYFLKIESGEQSVMEKIVIRR